jgi:hypothetical protein
MIMIGYRGDRDVADKLERAENELAEKERAERLERAVRKAKAKHDVPLRIFGLTLSKPPRHTWHEQAMVEVGQGNGWVSITKLVCIACDESKTERGYHTYWSSGGLP